MKRNEIANVAIEKYLALPWTWSIVQETEEGQTYWVVTVEEIPDFFAAGRNRIEAFMNGHDALRSHLTAYLGAGKDFSVPRAISRQGMAAVAGGAQTYRLA